MCFEKRGAARSWDARRFHREWGYSRVRMMLWRWVPRAAGFLTHYLQAFGAESLRRRRSGIGQGGSSPQSEPSGQVITQRCPGCLEGGFEEAAAAELAQAAAFLNPGVGELGEARALSVYVLGFFGGHLSLESHGCRWIFQA